MKIIEERDKAQREAEDYRDELEEQKKEFDCVYKSASDRLKMVLKLLTEVAEARDCAREYLPHVKHSYDDMNKGRAYEREQRAKHSWLGPPETPIDDIPD